MKTTLLYTVLMLASLGLFGQSEYWDDFTFTREDSLQGSRAPEHTGYDVLHYDLLWRIEPEARFLKGKVIMTFNLKQDLKKLQLDLFPHYAIDSILWNGIACEFHRDHGALFVHRPNWVLSDLEKTHKITTYYQGHPQSTTNAPWDEGFVWGKDQQDRHWIAVACEGAGPSLWWPTKDLVDDEPDSVDIRIEVPKPLFAASNGNLIDSFETSDGFLHYHWAVQYPINNYNISINIGHYGHLEDVYVNEDRDSLALDYYVLDYNRSKAFKHFQQVKPMLRCYEAILDKYPYWEDGFALIETPYLGMEHQSGIAYGNQYLRGYLGGMIPSYMDWDYIIIHESAHEYFGNSLTCKDLGDLWLHESFTTYMEALYVECRYGYEDYLTYMNTFRRRPYIINSEPIVGPREVYWDGWQHSDHYFKGSWVLHTLRHAIDNEEIWNQVFRGFYLKYANNHTDTESFITHVNQTTQEDFTAVLTQYLLTTDIPVLEYEIFELKNGVSLRYRWKNVVQGFNMPVKAGESDNYTTLRPTTKWQKKTIICEPDKFQIAKELALIDLKEKEEFR